MAFAVFCLAPGSPRASLLLLANEQSVASVLPPLPTPPPRPAPQGKNLDPSHRKHKSCQRAWSLTILLFSFLRPRMLLGGA